MSGPDSGHIRPRTLPADASVVIDYRDAELSILALVTRHLEPLAILAPVLEEVRGMTEEDCASLGIEVVEATSDQARRADETLRPLSVNDRLCLLVCRERDWTCVTNDRRLQTLCRASGVRTRFGLRLMVDLVRADIIQRSRAEAVARRIQSRNPLHIHDGVIEGFLAALDSALHG